MSTVANPRAKWRGLLTVLLDGDYPWGAIVSSPARYGAAQQRLVVYPPGITRQERRWLRAWRGWPLWGGVVWIVLQVFLLQAAGPWTALAVACSVTAVAGAAAFVMAGDNRSRVRVRNSFTYAAAGDLEVVEGQRIFRLLTTTLLAAHGHHLRGELSDVGYEHVWWQVYNAMAPQPHRRAATDSESPHN